MEKKESPDLAAKSKPGVSRFSGKIFAIIKFILGICLLPFVYSSSVAFLNEFCLVGKLGQSYFWSGVITFLVIYLFIWEPAVIYTRGHKILEAAFNFFKPLVKVAPYLLPIYTIILFIAYQLASLAIKSEWLVNYSIFLFGFSIVLHLVFSAKSVRAKQGDFLKANYIFGFSFIYIINLTILAFFLNLIFREFSIVSFFNNSFSLAKNIFYAVFRQLFLR